MFRCAFIEAEWVKMFRHVWTCRFSIISLNWCKAEISVWLQKNLIGRNRSHRRRILQNRSRIRDQIYWQCSLTIPKNMAKNARNTLHILSYLIHSRDVALQPMPDAILWGTMQTRPNTGISVKIMGKARYLYIRLL